MRSSLRFLVPPLFGLAAASFVAGCGGASETTAEDQTAATEASATSSSGGDASESSSPADHPALAPLRPTGADAVLGPLAASPGVEEHAAAALFYAQTDAPGMTLLWGMTAGAVAFDHPRRAELAGAMRGVLERRVIANGDGQVSVRLAPGATPAFQLADGRMVAPMCHLYEVVIGTALAPQASSGWSATTLRAAMDTYAQIAAQGTPVDAVIPLHAWLVQLEAAGHLDGYTAHVFDVATPEDEAKVQAAREWIAANPLQLARATLPIDLVPLPSQ